MGGGGGGSTPGSSSSFGASDARQPQGRGSALSPLGILCLGHPCLAVPAMAGLGTVTPRVKRPRRESSGDLGLLATKAGARRRARSRQREGDQGEHRPLQGWDPWERVPCPPLVPITPGKGHLAKLRLRERRRPALAPPCAGERGECVSPPGQSLPGDGGAAPGWADGTPLSPRACQPPPAALL